MAMKVRYAGHQENETLDPVDTRVIDIAQGIEQVVRKKKQRKLDAYQKAAGADRSWRYRLRKRAGVRCVSVDVSDDRLAALRKAGYLNGDADSDIRTAVELALASPAPL